MVQKCNKVQPKHGKGTQNMHGASRNYRYVWYISARQRWRGPGRPWGGPRTHGAGARPARGTLSGNPMAATARPRSPSPRTSSSPPYPAAVASAAAPASLRAQGRKVEASLKKAHDIIMPYLSLKLLLLHHSPFLAHVNLKLVGTFPLQEVS